MIYNKGGMRILDLERFGPMARKLPATPEFSKFFRSLENEFYPTSKILTW